MVISWEFSWMRFGFQIRYAYQVPGLMYTYFPRYLGIVCLTFSSVSVTQSAHLLLYMGTYDPVFTSTLTVLESRILESDDERTSNVKVVKVELQLTERRLLLPGNQRTLDSKSSFREFTMNCGRTMNERIYVFCGTVNQSGVFYLQTFLHRT